MSQIQSCAAELAHWETSLVAAWPADGEDAQGAWFIGAIDEDENKYEVITVDADQYDAPGDSEKIARAIIALWSQAFAARPAQTEQQPSATQQVLDLILEQCRYWQGRDEARRGGFACLYAQAKEIADRASSISQAAPQPEQAEQAELASKLYPLLGAWKAKSRREMDAKNAAVVMLMDALSSQGGAK
jgi:dTDP-4-dehydrorhamnose reductase